MQACRVKARRSPAEAPLEVRLLAVHLARRGVPDLLRLVKGLGHLVSPGWTPQPGLTGRTVRLWAKQLRGWEGTVANDELAEYMAAQNRMVNGLWKLLESK